MDKLGLLDAEFFDFEDTNVALHIGGVAVFDGPAPTVAELSDRYLGRLGEQRRLRQRVFGLRLGLARPRWFDDPAFDLSYHIRWTAVPKPGTQEQLNTVVGRIMSYHLDQGRPLWESWIIEGLADDRWALLLKVHHSMVDGIAGMGLITTFLDRDASDTSPATSAPQGQNVFAIPMRAVREIVSSVVEPTRTKARITRAVRGAAALLSALRPFTPTSLTGSLGMPRRFRTAEVDMSDVDLARHALGGTRNDVALAMVTHAFRELLISRDEAPDEHAVRCVVPVSVGGEHREGNQVSVMLIDLPVDHRDAATSYRVLLERTHHGKASHESDAGNTLMAAAAHLPPPLVSAAVRAARHIPHRVFTTIVTNVPGPRTEQRLLDRRLIALYPYVPIVDHIRIAVAITSYDGRFMFGVTCDRDSVPDADVFVNALEEGLRELVKVADATDAPIE